ncbi:retrovirus-related pol polyprotein from transposon TNT 1-94 [Tanacetum coccineum]|uniref:Retrovirus-related pol polyprotein from transposon TNT 1-94 n=1 Tax=Tanacetum coccineum TaxID=301880 RepID=A0ABQ4ZNT8_9ASTR
MNTKEKNVHHDKCDLEPINEEFDDSVAKLLLENERLCNEINHVKHVFKDQFDLIKQTCVCHKEQCDSLINKLNLKSMENEDLKAQIQDKVFMITSLKNNLQKSKGKEIVENIVHIPSVTTIAIGIFKLDLVPLPPRLMQNREVHINYLRNTQEQANILREIVEQVKAKQPLDGDLDLASSYEDSSFEMIDSLRVLKVSEREVNCAYRARYILVIVDDYSRFTWVRFLKTKDEAPAAIIKCIKNIQVHLKATVRNVRKDNGTEFVNQTLREWYENVGISHQTSVARTPQQNGVVERRNWTLVEDARTIINTFLEAHTL